MRSWKLMLAAAALTGVSACKTNSTEAPAAAGSDAVTGTSGDVTGGTSSGTSGGTGPTGGSG